MIIIIARRIIAQRIAAEKSYAYQAIAIFPIAIQGDRCMRCMFVQKQLLKGVKYNLRHVPRIYTHTSPT